MSAADTKNTLTTRTAITAVALFVWNSFISERVPALGGVVTPENVDIVVNIVLTVFVMLFRGKASGPASLTAPIKQMSLTGWAGAVAAVFNFLTLGVGRAFPSAAEKAKQLRLRYEKEAREWLSENGKEDRPPEEKETDLPPS